MYSNLCMNIGQLQPPIWCTLQQKLHGYGGWWIPNTNIQSYVCCVVAFAFVFWYFCPHKCTSLIIFGQVVCPNILKCQFCISWASDQKTPLPPSSCPCKHLSRIVQCLILNQCVRTTTSIIRLDIDMRLRSTY